MDNGVELYSEADKMAEVLGVLFSQIRPPNIEAVKPTSVVLVTVINACQRYLLENLKKNRSRREPGTIEQKQYNYTVHRVRELAKKYRYKMHRRLKKNVWKG